MKRYQLENEKAAKSFALLMKCLNREMDVRWTQSSVTVQSRHPKGVDIFNPFVDMPSVVEVTDQPR